jgi:hypothetical protein
MILAAIALTPNVITYETAQKKHPETMESGASDAQLYKIIDECGDFILVLPAHALDRCVENYCI